MQVRERFLNRSEALVFRELQSIASDNSLIAFAKPRLSDVLDKKRILTPAEFSMFSCAHFDFLLTNREQQPILAIEYDGPTYAEATQARRDGIKNSFCLEAGLPLVRIGANYVTRYYRGMTLLRWIIEVIELEKAFDEAQKAGQVPFDEPFDPVMFISDGSGRSWPYWLSIRETSRINNFIRANLDARSWVGLHGKDDQGNIIWLEYVQTEAGILHVKCKFRDQQAPFPFWDLMREVGVFEMGRRLLAHTKGEMRLLTKEQFSEIRERLEVNGELRLSHSSGRADRGATAHA